MARYSPLLELYKTRLREFYRQPARIFWVYGFPTVLAIGLGVAFRQREPEPVRVDVARNAASTPVAEAIGRGAALAKTPGYSGLIAEERPLAEALRRLHTGKTPLVVEPETSGAVVYHYDPTRPEAAVARSAVDDALQRARGREDVVATTDATVTEPGSRYIDLLIPGLMGLNIMGGGLWGIGFLLVNFRIGKLLKLFNATPMPRHDFLLAVLGARLTFLVPDVGVLLALGMLAFNMPFRGNPLLFAAVIVVGALAFAGIGLLVASRAKTTETVSGLMNLVMLPMWLLSGVFFSSEHFPDAIQPLIYILPLTQLVGGLRAVLLDGAGLFAVAPALGILAGWAVVTFFLALRIFRWS